MRKHHPFLVFFLASTVALTSCSFSAQSLFDSLPLKLPFFSESENKEDNMPEGNTTSSPEPTSQSREAFSLEQPFQQPFQESRDQESSTMQEESNVPVLPPKGLPAAKQHPKTDLLRLPIGVPGNIRAPLEPPVAKPEIDQFLEPGMYKVGVDIQPGLYYGESTYPQAECRWIRLKEPTFERRGVIISSDDVVSRFFVEVKENDGALYTTCPVARVKKMPQEGRLFTAFPPGTYLVGIDIPPGRYMFDADTTPTDKDSCVVKALSGFSNISTSDMTVQQDVIDSELWYRGAGRFFFEIPRGAIAITTSCYGRKTTEDEDARRPKPLREWQRPYEPPPQGVKMFQAGEYSTEEMPPGMYRVFTGSESPFCTVTRYQGEKEVGSRVFYMNGYQEILEDDTRVLLTGRCYLVPISELPSKPDPSQVLYQAGMYLVNYDILPGKYRIETGYTPKDDCFVSVRKRMSFNMFTKGETAGNYRFRWGEYFIEVQPTDVGLESGCVMERVE